MTTLWADKNLFLTIIPFVWFLKVKVDKRYLHGSIILVFVMVSLCDEVSNCRKGGRRESKNCFGLNTFDFNPSSRSFRFSLEKIFDLTMDSILYWYVCMLHSNTHCCAHLNLYSCYCLFSIYRSDTVIHSHLGIIFGICWLVSVRC